MFTTQAIATGTIVRVDFADKGEYVAEITGWQSGQIGLYELRWVENVPNYMRKGSLDLIEHERVSTF